MESSHESCLAQMVFPPGLLEERPHVCLISTVRSLRSVRSDFKQSAAPMNFYCDVGKMCLIQHAGRLKTKGEALQFHLCEKFKRQRVSFNEALLV